MAARARRFTALDHLSIPESAPSSTARVEALETWLRRSGPRNYNRSRRSMSFGQLFLLGSVVTLGGALILALDGHPAAAGALILASPFPCPPGMPC